MCDVTFDSLQHDRANMKSALARTSDKQLQGNDIEYVSLSFIDENFYFKTSRALSWIEWRRHCFWQEGKRIAA
jgi:hypothetical protein